jgi:hypothetical protein
VVVPATRAGPVDLIFGQHGAGHLSQFGGQRNDCDSVMRLWRELPQASLKPDDCLVRCCIKRWLLARTAYDGGGQTTARQKLGELTYNP